MALLHRPFNLDVASIDDILLNGVRHSFLPPHRKQELEAHFKEEMARLKTIHLAGL